MQFSIYLFGELACHRRGKVVAEVLEVRSLENDEPLPANGVVLMFGQQWQSLSQELQAKFWTWIKSPGCQVLLLPPYSEGVVATELDWRVISSNEKKTAGEGFAALLADEVRFQFEAVTYQFDRKAGHSWDVGCLNTLYYKPHSAGGVFAATSLPLWSLTCLDEVETVRAWFDALYQIAGKAKEVPVPSKVNLVLGDAHFVLLCCAYGQALTDTNALINRVNRLRLFSLEAEALERAAVDLAGAKILIDGKLQVKGQALLMDSPYKLYADELVRMAG